MQASISISKGAYCKSLLIQDMTSYAPSTREDYGVALFLNKDNGSGIYVNDPTYTDFTSSGITGSLDYWDIAIPNETENYEIITYYCHAWTSTPFGEGDIVYHVSDGPDSSFWIKNGVGTGTDEPTSTSLEWDNLDGTSYTDFINAVSNNTVVSFVDYSYNIACPDYMVKKKECNGYHYIVDNSDSTNTKRFSITDYLLNPIVELTEIEFSSNMTEFQLPEDNVYIVTIQEEIDSIWTDVMQLPIYEYCSLKQCATYLLDAVLCNANTDGCCTDCSNEEIVKRDKERQTLNQMMALYGSMLAYINSETIDYLGLTDIDADRNTSITMVANIMLKMKYILQRCGMCEGAWQDIVARTVGVTGTSTTQSCNC